MSISSVIRAENLLRRIEEKLPASVAQAQEMDFIPYTVRNGRWAPGPYDGICWWTNGFWPGEMWLLYTLTGNDLYLKEARRSQRMLHDAFRDFEHLHHDTGFMWRISTGFDFDLTGNPDARRDTELAGLLLAARYNPNGFIRAWNEDRAGWAIIDCMMNLSLLYWMSERTGDPRFRLMAVRHADTVLNAFLRKDGTCCHIVIFDPETGRILDRPAGQGYSPGSVWSRGQGWGIYGFAISYAHTGDSRYLDASRRIADAFLRLISDDFLPNCDFSQPKDVFLKDTCAGCVAACGLLELANHLPEEEASVYREGAEKLLFAASECIRWDKDYPALLTNCTGSYHGNDHHIAMNYADFFLIEGLARLLDRHKLKW